MVSLPRPKLFRKRRQPTDKVSSFSKFASSVTTFFAALFVSGGTTKDTNDGEEGGSAGSAASFSAPPPKNRKSIVNRIKKACRSNKVGHLDAAEGSEATIVTHDDEGQAIASELILI